MATMNTYHDIAEFADALWSGDDKNDEAMIGVGRRVAKYVVDGSRKANKVIFKATGGRGYLVDDIRLDGKAPRTRESIIATARMRDRMNKAADETTPTR